MVAKDNDLQSSQTSLASPLASPATIGKSKNSNVLQQRLSRTMVMAFTKPDNNGWLQVQPKPKPPPSARRSAPTFMVSGDAAAAASSEAEHQKISASSGETPDKESRSAPSRSPPSKFQSDNHSDHTFQSSSSSNPVVERRGSDRANSDADLEVFLSVEEIRDMVMKLSLSTTWSEAHDAVQTIRSVLKEGSYARKKDAATKLYYHQIVPSVVLKLKQFAAESDQMTEYAFRILVQMTYFEPRAKFDIVHMGGIPIIYEISHDYYPQDIYVAGNVTVLFSNLALEEELRDFVALPEHRAMIQHILDDVCDDEPYTQRVGTKYLDNIEEHMATKSAY